jgi:ATP-dependent Clp protease ATP-binding subunit ClpC
MPTFERFTDRAFKVLSLANQEAQRTGAAQVTPEHILFAFLAEARGVGALLLTNLKVDLAAARDAAERLIAPDGKRAGKVSNKQLQLSSEATHIVSQARQEARSLGHPYVGTEHLLLALLHQTSSPATRTLIKLGLRPEAARSEVAALVTTTPAEPAPQAQGESGTSRIRVGIVGVSGYGGGEALRLCAAHPSFEVV